VLGLLGGFAIPPAHAQTTVAAATFSNPKSIAVPSPAVAMTTGDVNHDGKLDLIAASSFNTTPGVFVMLGGKKGGFGSPTFWQLTTNSAGGGTFPIIGLAVADLNGDGNPDIVTANAFGGDPFFGTPGKTICVLLNDGKGNFGFAGQQFNYSGGSGSDYYGPASVTVSDADGSGKPEIIVGNEMAVDVWASWSDGGFSGWSVPSPAGNLSAPSTIGGQLIPTMLAVGDVNGDGKPDIVATGGGQVDVLLNQGSGLGFTAAQNYAVGGFASSVALGDVNGDGKLDIVAANSGNSCVNVLPGNGDGTFGTTQTYAVAGAPNSIALGDFNSDGTLDIVTTGTAEVDVLLNNGAGSFAVAQSVGPAGSSVVVADFNNDGLPDLT
jgi:hypothetical protein